MSGLPSKSQKDDTDGKKSNSAGWLKGAFTLTTPADFIGEIVCIDDCPNCPLWKNGCAGKCIRWDDMVCSTCPCLGSRYADRDGDPGTIDPDTGEPAKPDARLMAIRTLRRRLNDGEPIRTNQ